MLLVLLFNITYIAMTTLLTTQRGTKLSKNGLKQLNTQAT